MSEVFKKVKEDFWCGNCGEEVRGNGYTNHCSKCLWSKHVDVNPGDRAEACGGLMKPEEVVMKGGEDVITHQCVACGLIRRVRADKNDDISGFLTNMLK